MKLLQSLFSIVWRSVLVAIGYFAGLMAAGMGSALLGAQMPASTDNGSLMLWLLVSSIVLGAILCPLAARISLTRRQHFVLWLGVIFFNMGSVALEGKFFAPDLVPLPLPVLFAQQLLAAAGAALVITLVSAKVDKPVAWVEVLRKRSWFSWLWRFLVSASSYLVFYFIFGALNYSLVTRPYYDAHAGGLAAPAPEVVLFTELARAQFELPVGKRRKLRCASTP